MPQAGAQIAVLVVCHNGRRFLDDCLGSVLASDDAPWIVKVVVVDNASSDGSADYIRENFSQVDLVRSERNLGFAGGNNLGWEHIARAYPHCRYLALLNQDTIVQSGWLAAMADYLQMHEHVAVAQAKLLLHPRTDQINSAGNQCHFLGFGYVSGYGEIDRGQYDQPAEIDFASGAACLVRIDAMRPVGLFDPTLFLYLEDAELSWKLRQTGWSAARVPDSVVYHKYVPRSPTQFYYYLERNRWWLLGQFYKTPTLLLLLPALAAMELGQWIFAWRNGLTASKWRACTFFLDSRNWAKLLRQRRVIQRRRTISDQEFLSSCAGTVHPPGLRSRMLDHVGNPLLSLYWRMIRRWIAW